MCGASLLQRGMSLVSDSKSLAADFGPPSREAWQALVEKTLKGAPLDKLSDRTRDGLVIEALYRQANAAEVRSGPRDPLRPWDIRAVGAHPDPAKANAQALVDLENGAASILLKIDPAGKRGVAIASADDLGRALEGILLELAPVAL